jgi:hypothetical protein
MFFERGTESSADGNGRLGFGLSEGKLPNPPLKLKKSIIL